MYYLDGEVNVSGRVDYVDIMAFPHGIGRGRLDGDAALTFQLHRVHGCPHSVLTPDLFRFK